MATSLVTYLLGWKLSFAIFAVTEGLTTHGFLSQMSQTGVNLLVEDRAENLSYFQIWLFDIVNPEDVVQKGDKPALVEKGPYTYREYRRRYNITYYDNKTVSYREQHRYVFHREKSVGPESDVITTANTVMLTIADIVRYEYPAIQELIQNVFELTGSKLFTQHTVSEILWGYEDPLLKLINKMLRPYNMSIPDATGLFTGRNNTDDGIYTVFTEGSDKGTINRWNGLRELPYWTTKQCRMINGTVGRYFPPVVNENDTLQIFSSDAYWSFNLEYFGNTTDDKLYRFLIPDKDFADTRENRGFCTPINNCLLSGLWNITLSTNLAPFILSQPHFYAADKRIINNVTGLNPTAIEHQTILDIEPMTGTVRSINKRLQYNIYIPYVPAIKDTRFVGGLILPMIWTNQSTRSSSMKINYRDEFPANGKCGVYSSHLLAAVGILLPCAIAMYFAITTALKNRT